MTATIRSLVLGLGVLTLAPAALAASTTQDIQDAILARRIFTAAQLAALDINGDGVVDVADLVVLGNPVVTANFHAGQSVVAEGDPTAGVTVDLSGSFIGKLYYRIRQLPNGAAATKQVVVNGTSATIPVAVADDAVVDDARTLEIALLKTERYELGARGFHTLIVNDNDTLWNGSYRNAGLSVHFQLKILRRGGAVSGALVTDGFGIMPLNGKATEWPLATITFDDTHFSAEVNAVLMLADASQTGVPMQRRFQFTGTKNADGTILDATGTMSGSAKEWLTAATDPYLNRTLDGGAFTLQRRVPIVVAPDPVLEVAGH